VAVSVEGGREGFSGFNERLCRVLSLVQRMMDDAHHLAVLTTGSKSFRRVDGEIRLRLRSILSERVSDLFTGSTATSPPGPSQGRARSMETTASYTSIGVRSTTSMRRGGCPTQSRRRMSRSWGGWG
jgi:hypothetical protein